MSHKEDISEVKKIGEDIIRSERFQKAKSIPHHGNVSVASHSLSVAVWSLRLAKALNKRGINVSVEDAVRAALLHDIGMTEDDVFKSPSWKKAYSHPRKGVLLAGQEFNANSVQQDAIRRHMWPVCVVPPKHAAGWVVLASDKISANQEIAAHLTRAGRKILNDNQRSKRRNKKHN